MDRRFHSLNLWGRRDSVRAFFFVLSLKELGSFLLQTQYNISLKDMAKTRNRTKLSAANKAKTRAGKSKILKESTDQVQESLTVGRRKGKKKIRSPSPDEASPGPSGLDKPVPDDSVRVFMSLKELCSI